MKLIMESWRGFLAETSETSETVTLNPIEISQDDIRVELKKEGEKIKVYVNGNESSDGDVDKISAIISKAYKEIAQKIADGELDTEDSENILNWADALMKGKRESLQGVDKNRLSVLWNSWMEKLSRKF